MSVIEDTRKLIQDFLAPELRTITARLDALDAKVDANHREVMLGIANLANYQAVLERVAKLESRASQ